MPEGRFHRTQSATVTVVSSNDTCLYYIPFDLTTLTDLLRTRAAVIPPLRRANQLRVLAKSSAGHNRE
jgi:hypothetical protein